MKSTPTWPNSSWINGSGWVTHGFNGYGGMSLPQSKRAETMPAPKTDTCVTGLPRKSIMRNEVKLIMMFSPERAFYFPAILPTQEKYGTD